MFNATIFLLQSSGGGSIQLLFFAAFFAIFYFFFIRPQIKKQKETTNFLNEIKKGDRLVTSGGIHGKVISLTDNLVVLEVDSVKMKVEKALISVDFSKIAQAGKSSKKK